MPGTLPFTIDQSSTTPITDQVVFGFESAIRDGRLESGFRLPTIAHMALELGIGQVAMRNAMRDLALRGKVSARRKHGTFITGSNRSHWAGTVLNLVPWLQSTFFFATRSLTLETALRDRRIRCLQLPYAGKANSPERKVIAEILSTQPVDAVLIIGGPWGLEDLLRTHGVPLLQFEPLTTIPDAQGLCQADETQAWADLGNHLHGCKVSSIGIFSFDLDISKDARCRELTKDGFTIVPMHLHRSETAAAQGPDMVAFTAMRRLLADGTPLPDALLFHDDHHASGALVALHEHGMRIPTEIQLVTTSNRGDLPAFPGGFTRIERDPQAQGLAMAELTMKFLTQPQRQHHVAAPAAVFIPGGTTRGPLG